MSAKKTDKINLIATELLILTSIVFILLLTFVNVTNYFTPNKILGVETQIDPAQKFWGDFLTKNPNYIPGWVETGRMDKAHEIDPNYEITSSVLP